MGMWQNHRARQAGKYQKVVAQQQAQLLRQQTAISANPQQQTSGRYQDGYNRGWEQGWRAGQNDLIDALKTGRVRWEDIAR